MGKAGRKTKRRKPYTRTYCLSRCSALCNQANLCVGAGHEGEYFHGSIEYLRIARCTLAEARTTIEELYDWQFDGPFLRDFRGQEVSGARRDVWAFEGK